MKIHTEVARGWVVLVGHRDVYEICERPYHLLAIWVAVHIAVATKDGEFQEAKISL